MVLFTMKVVLCAEKVRIRDIWTRYLLHRIEVIHRPRVRYEEQAYTRWNKDHETRYTAKSSDHLCSLVIIIIITYKQYTDSFGTDWLFK